MNRLIISFRAAFRGCPIFCNDLPFSCLVWYIDATEDDFDCNKPPHYSDWLKK